MSSPSHLNTWCAICGGTVSGHSIIFPEPLPEDEYFRYNSSIIGLDDVQWMNKVHVLGFNPLTAGRSKFYVSGSGRITSSGVAVVGLGENSASVVRTNHGYLMAYKRDKGPGRVIPFHWECYEIFARYLTGAADTTRIKKGALYRAFDKVAVNRIFSRTNPEYRCLDLDYGDANEAQSHFWKCIPGKEYTVANPQYQPRLKENITTIISSRNFDYKPLDSHLRHEPESDPLTDLPEPIMTALLDLLDNQSLLNLCCASWSTFLSLRDYGAFWRRRITHHLPCFFELHDFLREQSHSLVGKDFRNIFLWAEESSKPKSNVSKFMFPIANRRRIWEVCEQIEKLYTQEPRQKSTPKSNLRYHAFSGKAHVVGDTGDHGLYFRSAYSLRGWHELPWPWTLDLFWNSEWDLSGIAVNFGEDQRIFGHEPQEKGAWKTTGSFQGGVWIKGFIFHIHSSNVLLVHSKSDLRAWQKCSWNYTSCKGVTVQLTDGSEHTYGQDDQHLLKMPISAAEHMTIVGLQGVLVSHKQRGVYPFIEKIKLLQARSDGGEKPSKTPTLRDHEGVCWNATNCMFKNIFLPKDDLQLKQYRGRNWNNDRWHNLVAYNTLTLAEDARGLSKIRSIAAYLVQDEHCLSPWDNFSIDVANLRVSTDHETRYLRERDDDGSIWPEQHWDTFQIDGPGGERIEEVKVFPGYLREPAPKAIEIHTNRGRSVLWGVDMQANEDGRPTNKPAPGVLKMRPPTILRADDGFVIIGVLMGCGKIYGYWDSTKDYMNEEDVRGPWTKEQYDKRNEITMHTGMSKVGIIARKITGTQE